MTFDFLYRTLQSWQQPESACISNCNCYTASVSPVCGSNGVTYLSACFAGCTKPVSWDITADNHCSPVPEGLTININTADLLDISLLHYHLISFCLSEPDQLCVYTQQQRRSSGFTRKVSQPRLSASLPHLPVCYMCVQHDWSYGPDTLCHHPYQVWARPPPHLLFINCSQEGAGDISKYRWFFNGKDWFIKLTVIRTNTDTRKCILTHI